MRLFGKAVDRRMKSKIAKMKYLPTGGQKESYTLLTARRRYMKKLMYVYFKFYLCVLIACSAALCLALVR